MAKNTKRLLCAVLSLLMVVLLLPQGNALAEGEHHKHGDLNKDGAVDRLDAVYLLYHSLWAEEYPLSQNGNLDGKTGIVCQYSKLYLRSWV